MCRNSIKIVLQGKIHLIDLLQRINTKDKNYDIKIEWLKSVKQSIKTYNGQVVDENISEQSLKQIQIISFEINKELNQLIT